MKRFLAAAACLALALPSLASAQDVKNYSKQGGADWEVGGVLNIAPGGKLEVAGVDVTATAGGSGVAGVASGYKIARGESALGGSNPTAVTTGLASIAACTATIKTGTAPGLGTSTVTYGTSGGTLNLYGWKPTSVSNPTLAASTGTDTIGWVCLGA